MEGITNEGDPGDDQTDHKMTNTAKDPKVIVVEKKFCPLPSVKIRNLASLKTAGLSKACNFQLVLGIVTMIGQIVFNILEYQMPIWWLDTNNQCFGFFSGLLSMLSCHLGKRFFVSTTQRRFACWIVIEILCLSLSIPYIWFSVPNNSIRPIYNARFFSSFDIQSTIVMLFESVMSVCCLGAALAILVAVIRKLFGSKSADDISDDKDAPSPISEAVELAKKSDKAYFIISREVQLKETILYENLVPLRKLYYSQLAIGIISIGPFAAFASYHYYGDFPYSFYILCPITWVLASLYGFGILKNKKALQYQILAAAEFAVMTISTIVMIYTMRDCAMNHYNRYRAPLVMTSVIFIWLGFAINFNICCRLLDVFTTKIVTKAKAANETNRQCQFWVAWSGIALNFREAVPFALRKFSIKGLGSNFLARNHSCQLVLGTITIVGQVATFIVECFVHGPMDIEGFLPFGFVGGLTLIMAGILGRRFHSSMTLKRFTIWILFELTTLILNGIYIVTCSGEVSYGAYRLPDLWKESSDIFPVFLTEIIFHELFSIANAITGIICLVYVVYKLYRDANVDDDDYKSLRGDCAKEDPTATTIAMNLNGDALKVIQRQFNRLYIVRLVGFISFVGCFVAYNYMNGGWSKRDPLWMVVPSFWLLSSSLGFGLIRKPASKLIYVFLTFVETLNFVASFVGFVAMSIQNSRRPNFSPPCQWIIIPEVFAHLTGILASFIILMKLLDVFSLKFTSVGGPEKEGTNQTGCPEEDIRIDEEDETDDIKV